MGNVHVQPARGAFGLGLWQLTLGAAAPLRGRRDETQPQALTPDQVTDLALVGDVLSGLRRLVLPAVVRDSDRRGWIRETLSRLGYRDLPRADRGPVLRYLQRLTGYSRAQLSRLVARWMHDEPLERRGSAPRHAFGTHYDADDLGLLAEVDALFGHPSGAVLCDLLRRQRDLHGDPRFVRLGSLSVSHLYQLRRRAPRRAGVGAVPDGWSGRRGPGSLWPAAADGATGHLRVDVVSLSWPAGPSVRHLRAIDVATQWQALVPLARPVDGAALLASLRRAFPFGLRSFSASCRAGSLEQALVGALQEAAELTGARPAPAAGEARYEGLHVLLNLHLPRPQGAPRRGPPTTPLERLAALPPAQQRLEAGDDLAALQRLALASDGIAAARRVLAAG